MRLLSLPQIYHKSLAQTFIVWKSGRKAASTSSSANDHGKEVTVDFLSEKRAGISVIGMNRPKAKNAFSFSFISAFCDALDDVRNEKGTRVMILRSLVKGVFCAGADLKERLTMKPDEVEEFVSNLRSFTSSIESLPFPVIAAIDGAALGGGLEMALACDIRIASNSAKVGLVETKLAIIPGAGGSQRLPRIIGPAKAKELIFTGRVLDGTEAHKIGLVNDVVEQNDNYDAAYNKAVQIAEEIAANGPIGVRMAKLAIDKGLQVDLNTGYAIEETCYAQLLHTKDRLEGLNAFVEKRAPRYKGE
ncbi:hypothetical protein J437_LFUL001265 [Ladona fulva]|uniref:Methylglutaconyl-CoA hydratase, mitochondrial n=1 Tax=Ladona fulva TaxID=123851 RepID=A0A8K0JTU6_LADFU|nr:hypothetical protein J437_LFUL001265 [Ladona fulva]